MPHPLHQILPRFRVWRGPAEPVGCPRPRVGPVACRQGEDVPGGTRRTEGGYRPRRASPAPRGAVPRDPCFSAPPAGLKLEEHGFCVVNQEGFPWGEHFAEEGAPSSISPMRTSRALGFILSFFLSHIFEFV